MTSRKVIPIKSHAKLSPSSSGRWLHCAGSVEANAGGSAQSAPAALGTAAHDLLEMCFRVGTGPENFRGAVLHAGHQPDDDMIAAVGQAYDWVNAYLARYPKAQLHVELEVDPAKLVKCAVGLTSGTLDVAIDNPGVELVMIDYKNGVVGVEAEGNTQLLQYSVGYVAQRALRAYPRYKLIIIQPRHRHEEGPVREVVLEHEDLLAHAKRMRIRIAAIEKDPTQRAAGNWCRWCAVEGRCKTNAQYRLAVAGMEFGDLTAQPNDPNDMSISELTTVLHQLKVLESWCKSVYGAGLAHLMSGQLMPSPRKGVPGWKLVLGRRTRGIPAADEQKALAAAKQLLKKDFNLDDFAPRSVVGVPGFEKVMKEHGLLERVKEGNAHVWKLPAPLLKLIVLSRPPIHIAVETDPRPAVTRGSEFLAQPTEE